jgi:hypothetical protein
VIGAGLFAVALTVPNWPDVVGRMETVQKGQTRRVGMSEVDMVIAMTERVSDLDDQFGGRHARPMPRSFTCARRREGVGWGVRFLMVRSAM